MKLESFGSELVILNSAELRLPERAHQLLFKVALFLS